MIKNTTKLLLASTLLASTLSASDTLTKITFEQDEDGKLNPNILVPIYWSDSLYSTLGYKSSTTKDISGVNNFSDSKSGLVSSQDDTAINWLSYKLGNYTIGLQTNFLNIDNNEFGYIHDSANVFGNGADYYIAFDNDIELDIIKTGIYLDYNKKIDNLTMKLSSTIYPSTKIDVKQSTIFKPLSNDTGTSSSSTSQDLGYAMKLEAFYDTGAFVKFGAQYSYDFAPAKYDIAQLAQVNGNYTFQTATVDTDETTTKYLAKIYFDKKVLGNLIPSFGIGKIKSQVKNNNSGNKTTKNQDLFSLGFEARF